MNQNIIQNFHLINSKSKSKLATEEFLQNELKFDSLQAKTLFAFSESSIHPCLLFNETFSEGLLRD